MTSMKRRSEKVKKNRPGFFLPWSSSPDPGGSKTQNISTISTTANSDWPTPWKRDKVNIDRLFEFSTDQLFPREWYRNRRLHKQRSHRSLFASLRLKFQMLANSECRRWDRATIRAFEFYRRESSLKKKKRKMNFWFVEQRTSGRRRRRING